MAQKDQMLISLSSKESQLLHIKQQNKTLQKDIIEGTQAAIEELNFLSASTRREQDFNSKVQQINPQQPRQPLRYQNRWKNQWNRKDHVVNFTDCGKEVFGKEARELMPQLEGKIKSCEEFYVQGNELADQGARFLLGYRWEKLLVLDLEMNQIKELPQQINNIPNVRKLFLGRNLIVQLPDALSKLYNLEVLHIDNNLLEQIPKWLPDLQYLKRCQIHENKIKFFPGNQVVAKLQRKKVSFKIGQQR